MTPLLEYPLLRKELWRGYIPALLTFVCAMLLFVGVEWYSIMQSSERSARLDSLKQREREAQTLEARANNERESYQQFSSEYQYLKSQRIISPEDRLALFERILKYEEMPYFQQINLTVDAQQPSSLTLPFPLEKQQLRTSEIELTFKTVGANFIGILLNDLKKQVPGLLLPIQCSSTHQDSQQSGGQIDPYPIEAKCTLLLMTFAPIPDTPAETPQP